MDAGMKLRPYQEDGLQALWSYFTTNKGNPVLAWPTGTGKSLVPAEFIRRTMLLYPDQRFLMITHVSTLIAQNYEKMMLIWPEAPIGIYSAGLKKRDTKQAVIYGGIQSMIKKAIDFGHRDIIFIDEAHLVNQDEASLYLRFIAEMKTINPYVKVIGMSATPYRVGQGMITDGGLFTDICHDLTSMDNFNKLIADGYLSPLIPKSTKTQFDISNVGIQKGDFIASQLQHEIDKSEITWKAMQELVHYGQNRKSWLIYATGISHSDHIAEMLNSLGIQCASVHSKQTAEYNDSALLAHKELRLQAIVSYSKLTTGLDHPEVDLIACLRPTMSVALWVQMLGRGTRIAEDKRNCLVLDYAKNTMRLGPINDPIIPNKKGDKTGDVPIKICEACGVYNHISARTCDSCGNPFAFEVKFKAIAGIEELIKIDDTPVIQTFDVNYVIYKKHEKIGKPIMLKATYFSGVTAFSEYVLLEHGGMARHRAHEWWRQRNTSEPPRTVDNALTHTQELRMPQKIRVHTNKKWPEIVGVQF
jgi:DNA repair protein RadD